MKALILAGGKGTRLSSLTGGTVPKPMAEMDGKPVLLRAVESLKRCGVTDFLFTVGHLHEKITDYFGDGSRFGVKIFYLIESEPLGSGGALFYAKDFFEDTLLVCSGDTVFDIDVASMLAFHREKRAEITLLAHPNSHPYDSDLIVTDGSDRVTEIDFKGNERRRWYANKVNAGFFLFEKSAFDYFTEAKKCNLERDFIYDRVKNGRPVYAYSSAEYIKDVGTPERFQAVEREVKAGIPAQKGAAPRNRASFWTATACSTATGALSARRTNWKFSPARGRPSGGSTTPGYLAILATNQPVIARGDCTFEGLGAIHNKLETELGREGGYLDAIYFCPHHPDRGFPGEVEELKCDCGCRKPKTGMVDAACERFTIDRARSYFVGDADSDVQTGINAGLKTVLVSSDRPATGNPPADWKANDLAEAVDIILSR